MVLGVLIYNTHMDKPRTVAEFCKEAKGYVVLVRYENEKGEVGGYGADEMNAEGTAVIGDGPVFNAQGDFVAFDSYVNEDPNFKPFWDSIKDTYPIIKDITCQDIQK